MSPSPYCVTRRRRSRSGGFSLVEILVVIGIVGVMAAIAIAVTTHINEAARDARNRHNAQFAASVYASARAAGASFSSATGDIAGVIQELNAGKNGVGNLQAAYFRLPTMPIQDTSEMISLLTYDPASGGLMMRADP
jgi:prepilin-type N-terminal cleavage/methylation domain-containing protein